ASALSAALAASTRSLGMVFALGAPRSYVMKAWLWWIGILSAAGIFLSLWVGRALMALLTAAFADLLPATFAPSFPWRALGGAAAAGFAASLLFAALPLMRIMDIPPNAVLANAEAGARRRSGRFVLAALAAVGVFYLIILSQAGRPLLAGQYLGGLAAVLAGAWILVKVLMTVLRRTLGKSRRLAPRLAARALSRPGNLNDAAVVSMAVSLSVILALFLLHKNLAAKFVESFPEDMPNVFFINIQTSQAEEFKKVLGRDLRLFPLVRGRVTDVNGVPVRELEAKARRQRGPGDRLTREFGFTFGEDLLPTDRVVSGGGLWRDDLAEPQVSVFDEYQDRFGIRPGDRIAVNVLGRKVTAVVSSLRSIDTSRREPFFYFYFRPGVLDNAPHTLMGGVRVEPDRVAELESRLAAALPNVTTIDLSEVAALTGRIMARLARIVGTLGLFGVISGLLLLVSGLWATLASRARESVLYRTLGASEGQLRAVALLEYAFIGFGAALTAWLVGSAAAWGAMRFAFKTGFDPYALSSAGLLAGAALAAAAISWLATRGAFRVRPMEVLRNE
ncbi:MAG: ABC transporter permease, partial [Elusimicrobiota bacterium]